MKTTLICFLFLCLFQSKANSQETFSKYFFKSERYIYAGLPTKMIKPLTGGYAFTSSSGDYVYATALDSNFKLLWVTNVKIKEGSHSWGFAIEQSAIDSSFCIVGENSDPARPEYDMLIAKIDKNGVPKKCVSYLWRAGTSNAHCLLSLKNGHYVIAVDNNNDIGIFELDADCNILKTYEYDLIGSNFFLEDITSTTDDGFLLTGSLTNTIIDSTRPVFCLKLKNNYKVSWAKSYTSGFLETPTKIVNTLDGKHLIFGTKTIGFSQERYTRYLKIDSSGNIIENKLNSSQTGLGPGSCFQQKDSTFLFSGYGLQKTDKNFNPLWNVKSSLCLNNILAPQKDTEIIAMGAYSFDKVAILKFEQNGNNCSPTNTIIGTPFFDILQPNIEKVSVTSGSVTKLDSGLIYFSGDTTITTICSESVLPLSFLNFMAENRGYYNELKWEFIKDNNTRSFEIERSFDNKNFYKIGSISTLYMGRHLYSYDDYNPLPGKNFYRIKIINNSELSYSDIQMVNNKMHDSFSITPNPAKDYVELRLYNNFLNSILLNIYNTAGRLISQKRYDLNLGSTTLKIPVNNLPPGVYFFKINAQDEVHYSKILKQ